MKIKTLALLFLVGCGSPPPAASQADPDLSAKAPSPPSGSPPSGRKMDPGSAEEAFYRGVDQEKAGDKVAAEKSYREALAKSPTLDEAMMNLSALLIEGKHFEEAAKLLREAIRRRKDDAPLHTNLAVALASLGDTAASSKEFEEAARLAPNDAAVRITHAAWLSSWKDRAGALQKLGEAKALAREDAGVLAEIGFEQKALGAFVECVGTLDRAISLRESAELRTYRGLCKLGMKDTEGAVADFKGAIQTEPNSAPAHYYLAGRYAEAGKVKEASAEYEAYLKLAPAGPLAQQAKDRLALLASKGAKKK